MSRIHYTKPSITSLELEYSADAAANGWGPRCYEYIQRFEREFSSFVGTRHAIATSSCTGALHMGLSALGVGPGDEVILADINWIASAAPITYVGARPVFVDVLPDSWCLDPACVEAAITPRTKAIIAVHIYGNLCELDDLLALGGRYGIPVIEDAAEAIGSYWHGRHAGSMGRFGVFSFHGTKTVTTGEGGMFVTQDTELFHRVLTLSNHGRAAGQPKQFWPDVVGYKYKMSNLQAAIGCAQMARIDELVSRKREIFRHYHAALGGVQGIAMNPEKPGTQNGFWMPTLVFDPALGVERSRLLEAFGANEIDARVFFWPLSMLPMFERVENPVSYDIYERAINLPSYHDLTPAEMDRVVSTVKSVL